MATLPEKIVLYCRQPDNKGIEHAFPVNIDSKSRHETAKKWAAGRYYSYSGQQSQPYNVYEYPNTGFGFVVIDSLEIRGEGGRAYQAIIHHDGHKFRIDLREQALMEVIMNSGIQAGGRLWGNFCFAVDGAQTYLIREESDYWQEAKKHTEVSSSKTIKKSELQVGHLYKTASGDIGVYAGDVFHREIEIENGEYKFSKIGRKMLFLNQTTQQKFDDFMQTTNPIDIRWAFEVKSSHSFKTHIGKVYDVNLEEVVNHIHKLASQGYDDVSNKMKEHKKDEHYFEWNSALSYYKKSEMSLTKNINTDQKKLDEVLRFNSLYEKKRRGWRYW